MAFNLFPHTRTNSDQFSNSRPSELTEFRKIPRQPARGEFVNTPCVFRVRGAQPGRGAPGSLATLVQSTEMLLHVAAHAKNNNDN